jgi:protein gp37
MKVVKNNHYGGFSLSTESKAGPVWNGQVRLNEQWLDQPLEWSKQRRIFVCAHGDLFHESVPDEWIDRVFAAMALAPQHEFQVLTKRAERMRRYLTENIGSFDTGHAAGRIATIIETNSDKFGLERVSVGPLPHLPAGTRWWPLANVWLGVSVEDQRAADERIPHLLATPAAVRFLSVEPLLGPVDLRDLNVSTPTGQEQWDALDRIDAAEAEPSSPATTIDWVIVGGESGKGARPMHPDWVRTIRDQCAAAGVPFFFKQWGDWLPMLDRDKEDPDWRHNYAQFGRHGMQVLNLDGGQGFHGERVHIMERLGKKRAGRLLDGRTHDEFPRGRDA